MFDPLQFFFKKEVQSFPFPFQDSLSVFSDIWELCTKITKSKPCERQKLFEGWVVGEANLTVAEPTLSSCLCWEDWLLPRFTGCTPIFPSLHCVEFQSTPWKRGYSEWAATLRPLNPKPRSLPWKSDGQKRLAWIILALTTSNKISSYLGDGLEPKNIHK